MGGAVSSGCDNNELIDNLMGGNYIRSRSVERVFRALDRADYMTPDARDQAYKDLAWRYGPLHMSAPCIYSEVMEGLELKPGLTFLNVGSGTGYLSTLVGLILGSSGISHGIEVDKTVVEYSTKTLSQFLENSPTLDDFDFCEPKFYFGNGLCIAPLQTPYDRVYCGAGCPEEYQNYFKQLIKVGGILVMPLNDMLLQVRRVSDTEWESRSLLNVLFATLRVPDAAEAANLVKLEEQTPVKLQVLARASIRKAMRSGLMRRHPELQEPPESPPRAPTRTAPRRICIPIEDDSDVEGLNALHDLDPSTGSNEMNALLSLVLNMGRNRVAGALRLDPGSDSSDSHSDSDDDGRPPPPDDDDDDNDDDAPPGAAAPPRPPRDRCHGMLTFEFRDSARSEAGDEAPGPSAGGPRSEWRRPARTARLARRRRDEDDDDAADDDDEGRDDDEGGDAPKMPAEVEIYLAKRAGAGETAAESLRLVLDSKRDRATDEETDSSKGKEEKRQKFDSGIGEENTPTASSPSKTERSDESDDEWRGLDARPSASSPEPEAGREGGRRRKKRSRCQLSRRSSSTSGSTSGDEAGRRAKRRGGAGAGADAPPPPAAPPRRGGDARRVQLSIRMKRGVKELPLPYQLKRYVNLCRCFEF